MSEQLTEVEKGMKCDCELKGEGCCSRCYDGSVITLPLRSDEERYQSLVEMGRQAHAQKNASGTQAAV